MLLIVLITIKFLSTFHLVSSTGALRSILAFEKQTNAFLEIERMSNEAAKRILEYSAVLVTELDAFVEQIHENKWLILNPDKQINETIDSLIGRLSRTLAL